MCETKLQRIIIALQGQHRQKARSHPNRWYVPVPWLQSLAKKYLRSEPSLFLSGRKEEMVNASFSSWAYLFCFQKNVMEPGLWERCCPVPLRMLCTHHTLHLTPVFATSTLAADRSWTGIFRELPVKELCSRYCSVGLGLFGLGGSFFSQ